MLLFIFSHTEKFSQNVGENNLFWKSPHDELLFGIQHYAGQVSKPSEMLHKSNQYFDESTYFIPLLSLTFGAVMAIL